jgi:hypothetical protein
MRTPRQKLEVRTRRKNEQGSSMEFTTFVRKPFTVKGVEITAQNIEEVSKYIGELRDVGDGTKYILVDPRVVPNLEKVYTGFYMTKMGQNVRCYSRRVFREQFIEEDDSIRPWLEFMDKKGQ